MKIKGTVDKINFNNNEEYILILDIIRNQTSSEEEIGDIILNLSEIHVTIRSTTSRIIVDNMLGSKSAIDCFEYIVCILKMMFNNVESELINKTNETEINSIEKLYLINKKEKNDR